MTEAEELTKQWKENQAQRADFYQILQSPAFKAATRLAEAVAVQDAESFLDSMPDELLSRRLNRQVGARQTLKFLKHLCDTEPVPEQPEEAFAHIDEKYLERKLNNQTE